MAFIIKKQTTKPKKNVVVVVPLLSTQVTSPAKLSRDRFAFETGYQVRASYTPERDPYEYN